MREAYEAGIRYIDPFGYSRDEDKDEEVRLDRLEVRRHPEPRDCRVP